MVGHSLVSNTAKSETRARGGAIRGANSTFAGAAPGARALRLNQVALHLVDKDQAIRIELLHLREPERVSRHIYWPAFFFSLNLRQKGVISTHAGK